MTDAADREVQAAAVRVLIVLPADPERLWIGGITSFVRGFVKFAPADFELGLVGVSRDRQMWRWHTVEVEGRPIRFLPVVRARTDVRGRIPLALRYTAALVAGRRRLATDGWILSFHRPATDTAFVGRRSPMWRVVHLAVEDLGMPGSESRWRRLSGILRRVEHRSFRRMERIYVVNEAAAHLYRARFPDVADRIGFLPNWADPTIFQPASEDRRHAARKALANELGVPQAGPMVLFAGRLEGQKDPLLMVQAFDTLYRRNAAVRLVVAGSGALEDRVRRVLAKDVPPDAFRLLGAVSRDRLAELMHATDALLITSEFETGPTVGLEALASGLPVVTTPVGQVARIVEASGAGQVAAERSAEALAAGLASVLEQPPDRLRAACAAAVAPFLADRVLGQLYEDNRAIARGLAPG